ncbi:MAG: TolC family protein, partial [bacterium]
MKRLSFTIFLLSAGAVCGWAQESNTVTLEEAVRIALERHPDIGKAQAAADVLKGKVREVRAQALPQVTISGGASRMRDPSFLNSSSLDKFPKELLDVMDPVGSNIFMYSIGVTQPLYTAGRIGTALRLASVEAEGSLADIDRAEQDLALEVVKAYYGLLWAERARDNVLETQEQRRQHADMARTLYQNGVATEVDVLRSEVAVANGQPDVVRAENAVRQARALLNYYLARPMDTPTQVAGTFRDDAWDDLSVESLMSDAIRNRPELARLRIAEQSAAAQLDLAKAESRFRADFNTEYGIMSRLPENLFNKKFVRWSFGANFTLPVFDGFKRSGLVEQAVANQRAARLEREKVEQQVRLAIQQCVDEL